MSCIHILIILNQNKSKSNTKTKNRIVFSENIPGSNMSLILIIPTDAMKGGNIYKVRIHGDKEI